MRIALPLALAAIALIPAVASAQGRANAPANCSRDLFQNEAGYRQQQTRLASVATADQATQCRAWREHVTYLQKARTVFATCQTGRLREENVGLMDTSLAEYRVLLSDRCKR